MLIAIVGENCVGKSTLASEIAKVFPSKIYSGKDFLRLDKNPKNAQQKFKELLISSVNGENVIYLITEREGLEFLPNGAKIIVLTAELTQIKERFKARMRGVLPLPVEKMLENKHGIFDNEPCHLKIQSGKYSLEEVINAIK